MPKTRKIRKDSTVKSTEDKICSLMSLPKGSIKIVLPTGRKANYSLKIEALRRTWDKFANS